MGTLCKNQTESERGGGEPKSVIDGKRGYSAFAPPFWAVGKEEFMETRIEPGTLQRHRGGG